LPLKPEIIANVLIIIAHIANRKEGYELTEMDFFEANTIHDLELVKAIAENRIYSSKKTSNDRFTDLFNNYDEWV